MKNYPERAFQFTTLLLLFLFGSGWVFWVYRTGERLHQRRSSLVGIQFLYNDLAFELMDPEADFTKARSIQAQISQALQVLSREAAGDLGMGIDPFLARWISDPQDALLFKELEQSSTEWSSAVSKIEKYRFRPGDRGMFEEAMRSLGKLHHESDERVFEVLSRDHERFVRNYEILLGFSVLALFVNFFQLLRYSRELYSQSVRNRIALSDLDESQARFHTLIESVNDYVFVLGWDLAIHNGFGKWFEKHGQKIEDLLGKPFLDYVGPENREDLLAATAKARQGDSGSFEYYHREFQKHLFVQVLPIIEIEGVVDAMMAVSTDITELVEARERYRAISEASSDFAYSFLLYPNGDFRLEWISDAFKRMTGVSAEKIGGLRELALLVHPEDVPLVRDRMEKAVPGVKDSQEYRYLLADGRVLWILDHYRIEEGPGGAKRIIGAARDITQEKTLRDTLAARDRQFRYAVENSSDILIHTDTKGIIEFISPAVTRLMGYALEDLLGRHFSFFIHPEDQPAIQTEFQALMEQPGLVRGVRCRMKLADGHYRIFEAMGWCQSDERGEPKVYGTVRDVSSLLDAERKGRVLEQAAQAVDDGILILRSEGGNWTPYYGNQGFRRLTGWEGPVEAFELDQFRFPLFPIQKWEDLIFHLRRFTHWNGELKLLRADGTKWDCFLEVNPFQAGDDQERYMVLSFHDITETKKAQEVLLKYERLATVGEISAGVAHEIKNPLAVIRVNAQNLQQTREFEKIEELETILNQCDRVTRILQETLDLGAMLALRKEKIVLSDLIERSLDQAKAQFGSGSEAIQIELAGFGDLPSLVGQRDRLERVFSNLILNAFQAMGRGERLGLYGKSERGFVKVTVRDSGHGILEKDVNRVFEPFYTTKKHGSGMGLAVCQRIVEEHGGWIGIEKHPVGTAFEVWLPTAQKTVKESEKESENESFNFG